MGSLHPAQVGIPALVRIRPGALNSLGQCVAELGLSHVGLFASEGFVEPMAARLAEDLATQGIEVGIHGVVREGSFEEAREFAAELPAAVEAILGIGGGKALDVAKYTAFLARRPYMAVPTSLSNDGVCSPQSSLTLGGRRQSLPASVPHALVVDTAVCRDAPDALFCSGVGDLAAKLTAVFDWQLAASKRGVPMDDLAAFLSDATVYQYIAQPTRDDKGIRLLATALILNGLAMEIAGSSRPASGSEHLISHALDAVSARPRLHGLQVGTAAYLVSDIQDAGNHALIGTLFDRTGFFDAVARDPFQRSEWELAIRRAPSIKGPFYTVLSERSVAEDLMALTRLDPRLVRCFVD